MIPGQLEGFMKRVLEETENSRLKWSDGFGNSFFCNSNSFTIHIASEYDEDRELYYYSFQIVKGEQITPFTVTPHDGSDYFFMKNLYEVAHVSANNITPDLDSFFN